MSRENAVSCYSEAKAYITQEGMIDVVGLSGQRTQLVQQWIQSVRKAEARLPAVHRSYGTGDVRDM